jgi:F420-non-reducing hydrogenase iron-sulfur subunit
MRLIRVMCSGRVDLAHVLRAFSKGADGVFLGACHLNECNYVTHGNYHALTMVNIAKKVLAHIGINPDRLRIQFMSGAEAGLFVESVNDFVKKMKELGPLGKAEELSDEDLAFRLDAVNHLIPYIRLVERERLRLPPMNEEGYETFFASAEVARLFTDLIGDKLAMTEIMLLLAKKPLSTGSISEALGLSPSEVSRHMNASSRHGLVRYDERQKCYTLGAKRSHE